jgi:hypothetical protein
MNLPKPYKYRVSWIEYFRDRNGDWDSETCYDYFHDRVSADHWASVIDKRDKCKYVEVEELPVPSAIDIGD